MITRRRYVRVSREWMDRTASQLSSLSARLAKLEPPRKEIRWRELLDAAEQLKDGAVYVYSHSVDAPPHSLDQLNYLAKFPCPLHYIRERCLERILRDECCLVYLVDDDRTRFRTILQGQVVSP